MADFKLHCFAQSGNAYKAALMLELCGADWEPIFVDFFKGEARSEAYLAINEMGEVPVLTHMSREFTQSGVMLDYLSSTFGRFGAKTEDDRRTILRWTLWDNHKLTANLATARFMMNFLPEKHRNDDVIAFLKGRAIAALKILDKRLEHSEWVAGGHMTTADLSCIGYIYFLDETGIDPAQFPNVTRWSEAIKALPNWKHPYELMPGHPLETA
jgi:glutathione S-transferase